MKINCGPTPLERFRAKQDWHSFFAIWPRRIGSNDCRFLETIERKGTYRRGLRRGWWCWEYRPIGGDA